MFTVDHPFKDLSTFSKVSLELSSSIIRNQSPLAVRQNLPSPDFWSRVQWNALQLMCPSSKSHTGLQANMSFQKFRAFVPIFVPHQCSIRQESIDHESMNCQWVIFVQTPEFPSFSLISSFSKLEKRVFNVGFRHLWFFWTFCSFFSWTMTCFVCLCHTDWLPVFLCALQSR